jgi:ABC-type amino acid transport substrate-binding protein
VLLRGGDEDTTDLIAQGIKANTPLLIDVNLDGSFKPMWRAAENSRRRRSEFDIPHRPAAASGVQGSESSVATLRDGLYWAVVMMTTVGYGDKTPKTTIGRAVAILWMLGSVVLVSLMSTSLVSRLTADRVETRDAAASIDLNGKKLAAVAQSSGAEYLDELHLRYAKFKDLPEALDALASGLSNAVVNSIGALQYFISKRYAKTLELPQGLLAPAYMAIALPRHSPLKRPIDRAYDRRRMEVDRGKILRPVTVGRSCRRSHAPGKKKS